MLLFIYTDDDLFPIDEIFSALDGDEKSEHITSLFSALLENNTERKYINVDNEYDRNIIFLGKRMNKIL